MASGLPPVRVDRERVAHVFDNLVGNALAPHRPGGLDHASRPRPTGDSVRFAVADTGEGIAAEHLPRIFEKFYRVPGSRSAGGAGLGLAIAREIVAAHGGQIDAASRPGEGTTFTFRLPIAREGDGQAQRRGSDVMSDAKHILIVDDEPNVRLVFRTALESAGYETSTAGDGEAALEVLERAPADLVLLDLQMPGLYGMEVLRRLRDAGNEVPVIFVTAHGSVPDAVAGDEARRHRLPRQAAVARGPPPSSPPRCSSGMPPIRRSPPAPRARGP